jgi:hypothetical protein
VVQDEPRNHSHGGDAVRPVSAIVRNVEDLLHERGVEISDETIRLWWHRFGPMFVAEIRKRRIEGMNPATGSGISTRCS